MAKTVYDIAKEAGVSVATVSRALNGSGYVSVASAQKIRRAAKGYIPQKNSPKGKREHHKTVGLIVSHDPEYFFGNSTYLNAMIGISTVANEKDFHLMLEMSDNNNRCMELFWSGMIDGAILMGIKHDNTLIANLLAEKYPFVLIGDYLDDSASFCRIDIDDLAMAQEAVQHLITLGHKRIGFVGGSLEYASCQMRLAGYKKALEEAGIPTNEKNCVFTEKISEGTVTNLVKKLLYQQDRVTAILAFNDAVASCIYKAAKGMGIRIPEGLSVVSFDDSDVSRCLIPALTTVSQPSFEKGYKAAMCLLEQMETPGKPVNNIKLESTLIFRDSCVPPPLLR